MKPLKDPGEDEIVIVDSDDDSITYVEEIQKLELRVIDVEKENEDIEEVPADYDVKNVAKTTLKDNRDGQKINLQVPCPTEADLNSAGGSRSDDNKSKSPPARQTSDIQADGYYSTKSEVLTPTKDNVASSSGINTKDIPKIKHLFHINLPDETLIKNLVDGQSKETNRINVKPVEIRQPPLEPPAQTSQSTSAIEFENLKISESQESPTINNNLAKPISTKTNSSKRSSQEKEASKKKKSKKSKSPPMESWLYCNKRKPKNARRQTSDIQAEGFEHICSFDGCGMGFNNFDMFYLHELNHRLEEEEALNKPVYECLFKCGYTTANQCLLINHNTSHLSGGSFACPNLVCGFETQKIDDFDDHRRKCCIRKC